MASHFTNSQWKNINTLLDQSSTNYSLPERRKDSVVIGSFNIRKLGTVDKRTHQSWSFLKKIISCCLCGENFYSASCSALYGVL